MLRFSILGWIDWCLLGRRNDSRGYDAPRFQYPRVDRLVSAGCCPAHREQTGLCFSILGWIDWCLLGDSRTQPGGAIFGSFSILGWIDWCLLVLDAAIRDKPGRWFQYPRVDRLVSAGARFAQSGGCQWVSVSSGGSIGVCWPCQMTPAFAGAVRVFQYPRVDRLVSAGPKRGEI